MVTQALLLDMVEKKYSINSITTLADIAKSVAEKLRPGQVFLLNGPVGAGKSTFVRLLLHHLDQTYNGSPTFGLYSLYNVSPDLKIIHMDLYNQPKSILHELYEFQNHVLLIEWSDNNPELAKLFPNVTFLRFEYDGVYRKLTIVEDEITV